MEAILFDLPVQFNYSGDSHPSFGFLPQFAMGYDTMIAKMDNDHPTIFKTILSTADKTEIPLEAPVTILNEYILTAGGEEDFPANSVLESSSVLSICTAFSKLRKQKPAGSRLKESQPPTVRRSRQDRQSEKTKSEGRAPTPPPKKTSKEKSKAKKDKKKEKEKAKAAADDKSEVELPRDLFIAALDPLNQATFKKLKVASLPRDIAEAMMALKGGSKKPSDLRPLIEPFDNVDVDVIDDP